MTNKTKLIFVVVSAIFAALFVLMSTQFAIEIAPRALSTVMNVLGLREGPMLPTLGILVIPGLYLYLVFRQGRRHS